MTPKDPFLEGTFWDKFWRPIRSRALLFTPEFFGDRYDWTTRGPNDGNEWRKHHVVPRAHPLPPLVYACLKRSGKKGASRLSGATWDHLRCAVEPSPGHIRCRVLPPLCHVSS